MLSEKVELLGKGLYETIPDVVNISSIPTASELEYVGAEDFDKTMVDTILPKVVEGGDKMNFRELLDLDYDWLCRCLRMKSYGPYFKTNRIFCGSCGQIQRGEYSVDLRTVAINVLPEGFINTFTISSDEFIDVKDDITGKLLTIGDVLAISQDNSFKRSNGTTNTFLARTCYMIKSIGSKKNLTPIDVRSYITKNFGAADYEILKDVLREKTNYGLQITGQVTCPNCGSQEAYYMAMQNDKFFRPSVGDVRQWKSAIRSGDWEELVGDPSRYVR